MNLKQTYTMSGVIFIFAVLTIFLTALFFETSRMEKIKEETEYVNVLWNDARLFEDMSANLSCDELTEQNRILGDRIYEYGLRIEKMLDSNKMVEGLVAKQNYALLDIQFWKNTQRIKQRCPDVSTVVYFYSNFNRTYNQEVFDNLLLDFKYRCGRKTIYITLPVDLNLTSVDFALKKYNITNIPAVLIDEKYLISEPVNIEYLNNFTHCW